MSTKATRVSVPVRTGLVALKPQKQALEVEVQRIFKLGPDIAYLDMGWSPTKVGLITSEQAWHQEMKRLGVSDHTEFIPDGFFASCLHLENPESGALSLIAIDPFACLELDPDEVIGVLVHESIHAWQHMRDHIGEHSPSAEFEAYQIEWIVRNLLSPLSEAMDRARDEIAAQAKAAAAPKKKAKKK